MAVVRCVFISDFLVYLVCWFYRYSVFGVCLIAFWCAMVLVGLWVVCGWLASLGG